MPQVPREDMQIAWSEKHILHPRFDITGLDVPQPTNRFEAMSMYSDQDAVDEKKPENDRATALARAVGHFEKSIYGDAFVGRSFYYENSNW